MFIKAKSDGYIGIYVQCKQEVCIIKKIYKEKKGTFRFNRALIYTSLIATPLYNYKTTVLTSYLDLNIIKQYSKHYNPDIVLDILYIVYLLNYYKILYNDRLRQTITYPNVYLIGMQRLPSINVQVVISYIYSTEFQEDSDNLGVLILTINKEHCIDSIRVEQGNPNIVRLYTTKSMSNANKVDETEA